MCCEHLVCASCAQPVIEARCPVCRAARAHVHESSHGIHAMTAAWLAVALVMLLTVAAAIYAHLG